VSLLSVNRVLATLGSDNVAVVHQSVGLQKKMIDQKQVTISKHSEEVKSDVPAWQPATHHLDALLTSMQLKAKATLNMTLSSDFVRYLALPAQPIHMSTKEKLAYAAASYREIYGEVVERWDIKLNNAPAHQTTIAVAIDRDLLTALHQLAIKHDLKLIGVQPYLMNAFNCLSKQLGKVSGYLIIVELKRLLLINLNQGLCVDLRTFPLSCDWQLALKSLMLRELMLRDTENKEVLVYAPLHKSAVIHAIEGWAMKRIGTLKNNLSVAQFSMLEVA